MLKFTVHSEGMEAIKDKIAKASSKAGHTVAIQIRADTSPYVPALTNSLDNRTRVEKDAVIYPGPYARYLYYGKLMVDPKTGSSYAKAGAVKVVTDKNLIFNKSVHGQAQSRWFEASKAENLDKWLHTADKAAKKELKDGV